MIAISNEQFEEAANNPDNIRMIKGVCGRYRGVLAPEALRSCGDTALWRCLKSHKANMGQQFTSSLYRFLHWECLRELAGSKHTCVSTYECPEAAVEDCTQSMMIKEYLDILPERARKMVVARYIENRTLADIGKTHKYSKQGVQNIIDRSLKAIKLIFDKD